MNMHCQYHKSLGLYILHRKGVLGSGIVGKTAVRPEPIPSQTLLNPPLRTCKCFKRKTIGKRFGPRDSQVLHKLFDRAAPALSCVKFFRKEIPQRCAQECTNFARTGQGPPVGLFAAPMLCGLALHPHTVYALAGSAVGVGAPSLLLETSDLNHSEFASLIKEDAVEDLKC